MWREEIGSIRITDYLYLIEDLLFEATANPLRDAEDKEAESRERNVCVRRSVSSVLKSCVR